MIRHHLSVVLALFTLIGTMCLAGSVTAQTSQDTVDKLKKMLEANPDLAKQLRKLLDDLDKKGDDQPPIPEVKLPGADTGNAAKTPAGPKASFTPDISVIGNHLGRFYSVKGDNFRNRILLSELEIGLQQAIFPGVRIDAFLTGGFDEDFKLGAEEAYASFDKLGHTPFAAWLGKKRLNFGKQNPIHPHARLYVDQPAALGYLLGPEALSGNGAALSYLIPIKGVFANVEFGHVQHDAAGEGQDIGTAASPNFIPVGFAGSGGASFARLWLSKGSDKRGELELGFSGIDSKAENGDPVNTVGTDLTYRMFPGAFKRLLLQGEAIWSMRTDSAGATGTHSRAGGYGLLSYRPNQYYDYAIRYDNSQVTWPLAGSEKAVSFVWTNYLNETTLVRLQYKTGDRTTGLYLPAARGYNEFWLQFLWGAGSHTHRLQ